MKPENTFMTECPMEMEEKVLVLAEGNLPEAEKDMVIEHLAGCSVCRGLLIDFHIAEEALEEVELEAQKEKVTSFTFLPQGVLEPSYGWEMAQPQVQVMDGQEGTPLVHELETTKGRVKIFAIPGKKGVTLMTRSSDHVNRLYVMGNGKTRTSISSNGRLEVANVEPGDYVLSTDLNYFLRLVIKGN